MRAGGSPARAALVLSLLLYSPGSHGGHIKWPPARAELATNLTPVPPGPGIRPRAQEGIPFMEALRKYSYFGIRPAAWSVDGTANATYPIELRVS